MSDSYTDTFHCISRLLSEYEKHPRLIIAVDFDDTVFDFHQRQQTHDEVIEVLKRCKALDFYVVLFTASAPERYEFMRQHMRQLGIKLDAINENPVILPYGNHKKIYYNILLDDRAGLGQALETLCHTLDIVEQRLKDQAASASA